MKFNKKLITEKSTVIHCKTEEEANSLLNWADSVGLTWYNGGSYKYINCYTDYKEETCYSLKDGRYADLDFYKEEGYKILSFEEVKIEKEIIKIRKVEIKSWNKLEKEYGLDEKSDIDCDGSFLQDMKPLCGQIVEINDKNYTTDNCCYYISEDMIEKNTDFEEVKIEKEKPFTKEDLRSGMLVELRNGEIFLMIDTVNGLVFFGETGWYDFNSIKYNLTNFDDTGWDIIKVWIKNSSFTFIEKYLYNTEKDTTLVYEREETPEVALDDIKLDGLTDEVIDKIADRVLYKIEESKKCNKY